MARKPAKMYRRPIGRCYTRKEYMGGIPNTRLLMLDMGAKSTEFPVSLELRVLEHCQVRHTALEAARQRANRTIQDAAGVTNYNLKINVYPHHILRENKLATGAGADRISSGMRAAFGKPVGRAARVKVDQRIITINTQPQFFKAAKNALRKAGYKIPSPTRIVVAKGFDLIQT